MCGLPPHCTLGAEVAQTKSGDATIIERPIGNDPELLRSLNPDLDIWDAYATIHVLMPDGSMRLGGEAVAEVLRNLPSTKWFTGTFAISVFWVPPFQSDAQLMPIPSWQTCAHFLVVKVAALQDFG